MQAPWKSRQQRPGGSVPPGMLRKEGMTLEKLLAKFRKTGTAKDALRLLTYLDRHPFAVCLSSQEDGEIVKRLRQVRERALSHPRAATLSDALRHLSVTA
jgi:hypothetical protein